MIRVLDSQRSESDLAAQRKDSIDFSESIDTVAGIPRGFESELNGRI